MDFLQEKLLGEKVAVSSMLLALTQNIQLTEAERVLSEFYESHKDSLDAAYQVTVKNGMKTSIKTSPAKDIPAGASSVRIYVVSAERASDPAVIGEVAKAVSELQMRLRIGDLKKAGYSVNPALAVDFVMDTPGRLFGPISEVLGDHSPKPAAAAKPAIAPASAPASIPKANGSIKREPEKASSPGPAPQPEHKEIQRTEPAVDTKPAAAAQAPEAARAPKAAQSKRPMPAKESSKTPAPKKTAAFPFAKVNKTEALAFNRQRAQRPVHESLVISDHNDNDENDEDTSQNPQVSRKQQLENLKNLYKDEPVSSSVQSEDDLMEVDEEDSSPESPQHDAEPEPEMEMDMEPLEQESGIEAVKQEPGISDVKDTLKDKAVVGSADAGGVIDKTPETETEVAKPSGKKTRRVLKTIITKDEEGFDVRERVYVDEDVEDQDDKNTTPAPASPAKKTEGDAGSLQSSSSGKTEKKPKAPPTIKKGNQTNLMSFFSKGR